MAELELTRSRNDRRLYELGALGSLRLEGFLSRRATATAAGVTWQIGRFGFFGRSVYALVAGNGVVGEFDPRAIRRGGELRWNGQLYELRPASRWRERYALAVGDTEVAVFDGKSWGRRRIRDRRRGVQHRRDWLGFEADRARRGGSGALHPQSALAGLNSRSRSLALGASTPVEGVDGQVPCAGRL